MLEETKDIELDPIWQKRYSVSKVFLYVLFIAGIFYLGYLIIFPSRHFTFDFNHPNSSKNSIDGMTVAEDGTIFYAVAPEYYSSIEIAIKARENFVNEKDPNISVRKSYQAFFYPQGKDILETKECPTNRLLSSGDSVFILSNNKKFPIDNPKTFELAGFDWNNVESASDVDIDLNEYEKQSLFNVTALHPDGTIFKTKNNNKHYCIKEGKKHELKEEALNNPELIAKAVVIDDENNASAGICKKNSQKNKYYCDVSVENISPLRGKDYRFSLNNFYGEEIKAIDLKFSKSINKKNLIASLSNIKRKICLRHEFLNKIFCKKEDVQ